MYKSWPSAVAITLSLTSAAITPFVMAAPTVETQSITFDLPADSLANTLQNIARLSNRQLSVDPALVRGKNAPAVRGQMNTAQAMNLALQGSGLELLITQSGSLSVQTAVKAGDAIELGATDIMGANDVAQANRINPATSVGSKIPLTAREIPQSVSVVSHAQIESQKMVDVQQALRSAPGIVSTNVDTSRYRFYSRGFEIDTMQVDGINMPFTYLTPPNLAMYDRIEVLRGPSGLYSGAGGAGGTINLVRKRPTAEFAAEGLLTSGTYDTHLARADIGGPLNETGSVRGRFVAEQDDRSLWAKGTHRDVDQFYGVIEADLSPDTTATAGISHQKFDSKSMQYGYPTYTDGSFLNINPRTFYAPDWNKETNDQTMAFAEIEHQLANDWASKLAVNHSIADRYSIFGGLRNAVNPATNLTQYQTSLGTSHSRQTSVDLSAWGPLQLFGRTHQLTAGLNWYKEHAYSLAIPGTPRTISVDLDEPPIVVDPISTPDSAASRATTDTHQRSLYANARWSLSDPLTLVTGVRATWWDTTENPDSELNANGTTYQSDNLGRHITPFGGLVYDLNDVYSVYGSYTSIFKPQTLRERSGTLIKPLEGSQYELGIKASYLDGDLDASAAIFQIDQENRGVRDPSDTVNAYYFAEGKARSRGFEMQFSGRIVDDWDVGAGYTYTNTRYFDPSADTGRAAFSAYTPKHLLKVWTQYTLPGALDDISLNLSTYATSAISTNTNGVIVRQGGYATVDAGISYRINEHVTAGFNVTNLLDRRYYQSIQTPADHNYLGNPRMSLASLEFKY